MAHFSAATVFTAIDKFSQPVQRMQDNVNKFSSQSQGAVNKLNERFKTMGRTIIAGAGFLSVGAIVNKAATSVIDFDSSIASLKAITGLSGKAFEPFKEQIIAVGDATKKSYVDVAKSMELIGSAQPELLNNASAMGEMTRAAILLSKASGMDLPTAAGSLSKALNQFGASADQAAKFVDILSTSEQKGTATTPQIIDALINGGSAAKTLGLSFDETNAIIQAYAKAGVIGSEAGTQMASVLSKLAASTVSKYNPSVVGATKAIDNLAKSNMSYAQLIKMFGPESAKFMATLINQNDVVQKLSGNLYDVGNAQKQANERNLSFKESVDKLVSAFSNQMIKANESAGALKVVGSIIGFVANNIGFLINSLLLLGGAFLVWKIGTALLYAYNLALDLVILSQGYQGAALLRTTAALKIFAVWTKIVTVAQWLWNAAMTANPIGLIIVGIGALIAAIAALVIWWDKVKKKVDEWSNSAVWQILKIVNPIMAIIELVSFLQDRWDGIKKAFTEGGFLNGIKAIGAALLSFVLKPFEVILKAIGKLTGADWAINASASIGDFRKGLDNPLLKPSEQPVNKDAAILQRKEEITTTSRQNVQINIDDSTGKANVGGQLQPVPVVLNNTKGYGF